MVAGVPQSMSLRTDREAQQSVTGAGAPSDDGRTPGAAASFIRRNEPVRKARDLTSTHIDHDRASPRGPALLTRDLPRILAYPELRRAIATYAALLLGLLAAALWFTPVEYLAALVVIGWLLFPPTEYAVHRYVLHPLIYLDTRISARFWIRVHFAHHDHPSRTDVILASPISVVMLVLVLNVPIALVAGPSAVFAGTLAILLPFVFYEFVHFSIHAPIDYTSPYLQNRQRLHLLHHFHNEKRNYGICASIVDKIVGTYTYQIPDVDRSATARNLGYDEAVAREKPLVRIEYERRYLGK
jgi:sterol desaturase/sphingolipid hydroxylase (fatty acid hydroxylase superfamily)